MKTVTINVTEEDIREGVRANCDKCPIARAVSRSLGVRGFAAPMTLGVVDGNFTHGVTRIADTPRAAKEWMKDFDEHREVQPFSFTIEVPEEFLTKEIA